VALLLVCWWPAIRGNRALKAVLWPYARLYSRHFAIVFHVFSIAFAAVHLHNFNLSGTPLSLLPLLVLPQWLTGMVLGWMRVRYGIGSSILLHSIFNSGPLLLVWLILRYVPDIAAL